MEGCRLNRDLICEILKKVDACTLFAVRSACCRELKSLADDESLWECLCQKQWPSTKRPKIKSVIISVGGFKKFFTNCFPLPDYGFTHQFAAHVANWSCNKGTEWVSIVDVVYRGSGVFSEIIEGISPVKVNGKCLSGGPIWIDAVDVTGNMLEINNPTQFSLDLQDMSGDARFVDNMQVSWIVVNRVTKQVRNLCGFKPYKRQQLQDQITVSYGCSFPDSSSISGISCCSADLRDNKNQINSIQSGIMSGVRMHMSYHDNESMVEVRSLSVHLKPLGCAAKLNGRESFKALYWLLNQQPCALQSPPYNLGQAHSHSNGLALVAFLCSFILLYSLVLNLH